LGLHIQGKAGLGAAGHGKAWHGKDKIQKCQQN